MFIEINYKKISTYYHEIISYILYTSKEYDYDEYLNAYSYLERAIWRLNEIQEMSDFYNEKDFFYFGMENLSNARHRIQHYLEDTETELFNDLKYKKYDGLVIDYYQPIRLNQNRLEENHNKWEYYWELHNTAQLKQSIKEDCKEIIVKLNNFIEYLDSMDYNSLKEHSNELENLNESTLNFLLNIPYVPKSK